MKYFINQNPNYRDEYELTHLGVITAAFIALLIVCATFIIIAGMFA